MDVDPVLVALEKPQTQFSTSQRLSEKIGCALSHAGLMIVVEQIISIPGSTGEMVEPEQALRLLRSAYSSPSGARGYVIGRTRMRNTIAEKTGCSLLHAEQLIAQLSKSGDLRYGTKPGELETGAGYWSCSPRI